MVPPSLLAHRRQRWLSWFLIPLLLINPARSAGHEELRQWLEATKGKANFFGADPNREIEASLRENEIIVVGCTDVEYGRCIGACAIQRLKPEPQCGRLLEWGIAKCVAATQPINLCAMQGCQDCSAYPNCNEKLAFGFCRRDGARDFQVQEQPPVQSSLLPTPATSSLHVFPSVNASASLVESSSSSLEASRVVLFATSGEVAPSGDSITNSSPLGSDPLSTPSIPGSNGTSPTIDVAARPTTTVTHSINGSAVNREVNTNSVEEKKPDDIPIGLIVGSVIGFLALIILTLLLLLCYRRWKAQRTASAFNPLLMQLHGPVDEGSQETLSDLEPPAPRPMKGSRRFSFSSWTGTVKLPDFGYQSLVKSRPSSMAASFMSTDSTVVLHELTESRATKRTVS